MNKNMEEWFAQQDFSTDSLPSGHRNRFLEKLDLVCEEKELKYDGLKSIDNTDKEDSKVVKMNSWFKWSLVAGLAVLMGFAGMKMIPANTQEEGLASVSPKMAEAQDFFTTTINMELEKLNNEQSPETERIIADTKSALNKMETDYKAIKKDFQINQDSKAVIAAMIQNFQTRIELLETALEQIEQLKTLKQNENEEYI